MDERVRDLQLDFPSIFERYRGIKNFEDDWVVIDVSDGDAGVNTELYVDGAFVEDLGRHADDGASPIDEFATSLPPVSDLQLPPDVDVPVADLIRVLGRPRPKALDRFRRKIKGVFPGGPAGIGADSIVPPPDALALYLPFHRYPDLWGIYLLDAGVASLGRDLAALARLRGQSLSLLDARRAAVTYLFHHEAYHSAVEGFALRAELPLRKPVYKAGLRSLFTRPWTAGEPHEETLATAYGIRQLRSNLRLPEPLLEVVTQSLRIYMAFCPPPYREGIKFLDDERFNDLERRFMEEAIRCSAAKALPASAWTMGTYLMTPLLQRNRRYSWICDRADFYKRSRLAVHYFRRRDVLSCLERLAGAATQAGGRHLHLVRTLSNGKFRRTQVPSGEVHRGTLAGMLKDLDLDLNVDGFRSECRKLGRSLS
jgi:hypothetical protein